MPSSPEARHARARLAAYRRWHPGDDLDELTEECRREFEAARDAAELDDAISIIERAADLTPEQGTRIQRWWDSIPDGPAIPAAG